MKKIVSIAVAILLVVGLSGCFNGNTEAKVGKTKITKEDLNSHLALRLYQSQMNKKDMSEKDLLSAKKQALNDLINYALVREYYSDGKDKDGKAIITKEAKKQFEDFKKQLKTDQYKEVRAVIKDNKISDEFLEQGFFNQFYMQAFTNEIMPSEKELEEQALKYFNENLKDDTELQASHILMKDKAKAEKVLKQINDGGDFATLAKENSEDPGSAEKGGDVGTFGKGKMVDEFYQAALKLEVGQVSGLVKSDYGYHIIKLTGKNVVTNQFEGDIKDSAILAVKTSIYEKKMKELKKKFEVKILNKDLKDAMDK